MCRQFLLYWVVVILLLAVHREHALAQVGASPCEEHTDATPSASITLEDELRRELGLAGDVHLPDRMRALHDQQGRLVAILMRCIAVNPRNLEEEQIAESAARLLGGYNGDHVVQALSKHIDLTVGRFPTQQAVSAEGGVSYIFKKYPCTRALMRHGGDAMDALIDLSVSPQRRSSDLQLELAAYTLLELQRARKADNETLDMEQVRQEVMLMVEERYEQFQSKTTESDARVNVLQVFLQEIDLMLYRYPQLRERDGLIPASGSAVFGADSEAETKAPGER